MIKNKRFKRKLKSKTLSVCLIYEFLSEQGGLEREMINHANMLREKGYIVNILTCHLDRKLLQLLPFNGIPIEEISRIKTPFEWVNIALCFLGLNRIEKHTPDIFLSYSAPSNFLIRKSKAKKINYMNHFPHYLYLSEREKIEWAASTQGMKRWISVFLSRLSGSWMKRIDKKLVSKNDCNFANSYFTKGRLDALYGIQTIVSYPPLDPRFAPGIQKKSEKYIFTSGRIIPDKKYEWLLESLSLVNNKLPLYMAGSVEENYKKSLLKLAERNKVQIKFLGRLNTEEIIQYYTSAAVFAFPTPGEDFGLVPVESMACGTPVVVWGDGAGPSEQVIDGVTGYHAQPYNLRDFASKIDEVIDSNLKRKNRAKILQQAKKFSYKEIKKGFIDEINAVIKS